MSGYDLSGEWMRLKGCLTEVLWWFSVGLLVAGGCYYIHGWIFGF